MTTRDTVSELTDERLREILAAAEKATPGPWYQTGDPWFRSADGVLAGSPDGNIGVLIADCEDFGSVREDSSFPTAHPDDDAAYLAKCDPQTTSTIVSEVLSHRSAIGEAVAWLIPSACAVIGDRERAETMAAEGNEVIPLYAHPLPSPQPGDFVSRAAVDQMLADWQEACAAFPDIYNQGNVLRDRLKALASPSSTPTQKQETAWEVKPLEWVGEDIGWTSQTELGEWVVDHDDDEDVAETPWSAWGPQESIGHFSSEDEAKAAAQSDYESRIRSALIASPAHVVSEEWQDISTAPKDGASILLAHHNAVFSGWWDANEGGWVDGCTDAYEELITYEPTHWKPLPAPPALSHDKGE